jgi:hypothetical protein
MKLAIRLKGTNEKVYTSYFLLRWTVAERRSLIRVKTC